MRNNLTIGEELATLRYHAARRTTMVLLAWTATASAIAAWLILNPPL